MGRLWVRHAPESAAVARRTVMAALSQAGIDPNEVLDGALIASELVSNAVRHAEPLPSGHILIGWHLAGNRYTLSVTDGGPATDTAAIAPAARDTTATTGRGLSIVAEIADAWGVSHGLDGSATVWARRTFAPADERVPAARARAFAVAP